MQAPIIPRKDSITLLGGGKARAKELADAINLAPILVAVDGAAGFALQNGFVPHAVIGDMDSISPEARAAVPADRLHVIADQDTTDFDKALRSISAPLILGVGFLGRRVDHQLANFNVLVRRAEQPCILMDKRDVVLAAPPRIALNLEPGSRISLFPMARVAGRSVGLNWPIDGLVMSPQGIVGTSNHVAERHSGPVLLEFDQPGMLIILPRAALSAAISGLAQSQAAAPLE